MAKINDNVNYWWGQLNLEIGAIAYWEIGPLALAVQRLNNEWRFAHKQIETYQNESRSWSKSVGEDSNLDDYPNIQRFVMEHSQDLLTVKPALADRPVVTRPITPFHVPANEEIAVYISSPLWLQAAVGKLEQPLLEFPIRPPKDTWFGLSTLEGELCYASRTFCRLNLEEIPIRPNRATTQVIISNKADSTLLVERLSLPVPYLSLFATPDGFLWTESVKLLRGRDSGMAQVGIEKKPSDFATNAELIAKPRQESNDKLIIRAFAVLREATKWSGF